MIEIPAELLESLDSLPTATEHLQVATDDRANEIGRIMVISEGCLTCEWISPEATKPNLLLIRPRLSRVDVATGLVSGSQP